MMPPITNVTTEHQLISADIKIPTNIASSYVSRMVNKEYMANDMLPTRKAATLKISFPSITDDTAAHRKIFTTKTFCLLMQQS